MLNYKNSLAMLFLGFAFFNHVSFAGDLVLRDSSVFVPQHLGKILVTHGAKGFNVSHDGTTYEVKKYLTERSLRTITNAQLKAFLAKGYLAVNKMDNGDFTLKAHVRGPGGGILTGLAFSWIVRLAGYGGPLYSAVSFAMEMENAQGVEQRRQIDPGAVAQQELPEPTSVASDIARGTVGVAKAAMGSVAVYAAVSYGATGAVPAVVTAVESAAAGAFIFGAAIPFLP